MSDWVWYCIVIIALAYLIIVSAALVVGIVSKRREPNVIARKQAEALRGKP